MAACRELRSAFYCVFTEYLWSAQQGPRSSTASSATRSVPSKPLAFRRTSHDCCHRLSRQRMAACSWHANITKCPIGCSRSSLPRGILTEYHDTIAARRNSLSLHPRSNRFHLLLALTLQMEKDKALGAKGCFAPPIAVLRLSLSKQQPCLKRTISFALHTKRRWRPAMTPDLILKTLILYRFGHDRKK